MLVNDERMKLFINAALMNCLDLNYFLFHKAPLLQMGGDYSLIYYV